MGYNATHPQFDAAQDALRIVADFYAGSAAVKDRNETYLPPMRSVAMLREDDPRAYEDAYAAYRDRAEVPAYVADAVDKSVGIMHAGPPAITLPAALERMLDDATGDGTGLAGLMRNINAEQLLSGRVGLALDAGPDGPVIRMYYGASVRNWQADGDTFSWVLLGEQTDTVEDYVHKLRDSFRLMALNEDGAFFTETQDARGAVIEPAVEPAIRGRKLDRVPFVTINVSDIAADMDKPPLLPLAEKCASIYRLDADHKHNLHMQSAATLVVSGLIDERDNEGNAKPLRVGASGLIRTEIGGDGKFAQPGAEGLSAQQAALDAMHRQARDLGADMLGSAGAGESGDALTVRLSSRTASLRQVAFAGAAGLEKILRMAAQWVGANPNEVVITPYTDDTMAGATGEDLLKIASAANAGFPISLEAQHWYAKRRGFTPFEYDEEMDRLANQGVP